MAHAGQGLTSLSSDGWEANQRLLEHLAQHRVGHRYRRFRADKNLANGVGNPVQVFEETGWYMGYRVVSSWGAAFERVAGAGGGAKLCPKQAGLIASMSSSLGSVAAFSNDARETRARRSGAGCPPVLDLEDAWPANEPLPVRARIFDREHQQIVPLNCDDVAKVRVQATTNEGDWIPMVASDGGAWSAELPALQPGPVEVTVEATTQTGIDPPAVNEPIVVVATARAQDADGGTA